MKKACRILCIIGGILAIVGVLGYLIAGILLLVSAGMTEVVQQAAAEQNVDVETLQTSLMAFGAIFLVFAVFSIPCAIVSFITAKKVTLPTSIACIVLAILGGTGLSALGGIFGIVYAVKNKGAAE